MVPAFGMVILPQNLSTGKGKIPGCSCILTIKASNPGPDTGRAGGAVAQPQTEQERGAAPRLHIYIQGRSRRVGLQKKSVFTAETSSQETV